MTGMKKPSENLIMIFIPLIMGLLSLLFFVIYLWGANHAPYHHIDVIIFSPICSVIGVIFTIITRKSRNRYPMIWLSGLVLCLLGLAICILVFLLLASIMIAAFNGEWL